MGESISHPVKIAVAIRKNRIFLGWYIFQTS
jgi:hypothetical protein